MPTAWPAIVNPGCCRNRGRTGRRVLPARPARTVTGPRTGHPRAGADSITAFGARAPTPVADQDESCVACHRGDLSGWHGGTHDSADVGCAACHRVHVAQDPMSNPRRRQTPASPATRASGSTSKNHTATRSPRDGRLQHLPRAARLRGHRQPAPADRQRKLLRRVSRREARTLPLRTPAGSRGLRPVPRAARCIHPAMLTRRTPALPAVSLADGSPGIISTPGGLPGGSPSPLLLAGNCLNCHSQVHGSNHPSGVTLIALAA